MKTGLSENVSNHLFSSGAVLHKFTSLSRCLGRGFHCPPIKSLFELYSASEVLFVFLFSFQKRHIKIEHFNWVLFHISLFRNRLTVFGFQNCFNVSHFEQISSQSSRREQGVPKTGCIRFICYYVKELHNILNIKYPLAAEAWVVRAESKFSTIIICKDCTQNTFHSRLRWIIENLSMQSVMCCHEPLL